MKQFKPLDLYTRPGPFQRTLDFSYHVNPAIQPITEAQQLKLTGQINRLGKQVYQDAKRRLEIPMETTITRLSKQQAIKLIDELNRLQQEINR